MFRLFILLILTWLFSLTCNAAETKFGSIVLLQPDYVLQEHGLKVDDLGNFIKSMRTSTAAAWQSQSLAPSSGFLVVAVREGRQVNAWLDFEPSLTANAEKLAIQAIRAIPAFPVAHGTVIFAIKASLNGASETSRTAPMPQAWKDAMKTRFSPVETEDLVKIVWP